MLLAIAKESPRPGWLLLAEGVPVTVDDLADEAAIAREEVEAELKDFEEQRMVEKEDGVWRLLNWDKRQFASDSGRERVQKHREKKKDVEAVPEQYSFTASNDVLTLHENNCQSTCNAVVTLPGSSKPVSCNGDVTLPKRYKAVTGNVTVTPPETETDTDTEIKEKKKDLCSCSSNAPVREEDRDNHSKPEEKPDLFGAFEQEFGRPLSPAEIEQVTDWAKEHREPIILEALKRATLAGKYQFRYINGILTNWTKNKLRTVYEINEHEAAFRRRDGPKGGQNNGQGFTRSSRKNKPGYRPSEVDWSAEPDTL